MTLGYRRVARGYHPLHVAGALAVLETELEEELKGEDGPLALDLLRGEIKFESNRARVWAASRDLGFYFEEPDPDSSAEQCVRALRRLAEALRDLARRAVRPTTNGNAADDEEDDPE